MSMPRAFFPSLVLDRRTRPFSLCAHACQISHARQTMDANVYRQRGSLHSEPLGVNAVLKYVD
jgi:hypothetical protein